MDEVVKMLITGKKVNVTFIIALALFLGYQYADFRSRLNRIEERITAVENKKP